MISKHMVTCISSFCAVGYHRTGMLRVLHGGGAAL